MSRLSEIKEKLKKYKQEHLLQNYELFNDDEKEILLNQIDEIDFELINQLYQKVQNKEVTTKGLIEPLTVISKELLSDEEKEEYRLIGEEVLKSGKYAVITPAGGQGSRLGFDGPKGTFIVNINPPKSIFEIHCDLLKENYKKYSVYIPWFIMVSRENEKATREFFKANNYFDYPKEYIDFFVQHDMESVLENGKIILDEKGFIYRSPSGNGVIYKALAKKGIVDRIKKDGLEWFTIANVDNILAKLTDPFIIGAAIKKGYMAAAKSILKVNCEEKVGVFARQNGMPTIIEYMEFPEELAKMVDQKGTYIYGDANPVVYLFHITALEKFVGRELTYHPAYKAASYLNEKGIYVKAEQPNSYKFESFINDTFDQLDDMLVFRVKREEEFAPIKNKEGADSPETAIKLYEALNKTKKDYEQ